MPLAASTPSAAISSAARPLFFVDCRVMVAPGAVALPEEIAETGP
jgi:hypothetical protein